MLAKRIARESTVSPADTHAVLRALPNVMADFMKESRAIHFEGLGWFRYSINAMGKGVENREDVSDKQIKGLRVQFTPDRTRNMESGGYTRALIASEGLTFMEWLGKESDETQVPEEPGGSGSESGDGNDDAQPERLLEKGTQRHREARPAYGRDVFAVALCPCVFVSGCSLSRHGVRGGRCRRGSRRR